jgi:hypothetical protein
MCKSITLAAYCMHIDSHFRTVFKGLTNGRPTDTKLLTQSLTGMKLPISKLFKNLKRSGHCQKFISFQNVKQRVSDTLLIQEMNKSMKKDLVKKT